VIHWGYTIFGDTIHPPDGNNEICSNASTIKSQ